MPAVRTVLSVVGSCPNFMKIAPIAAELQKRPGLLRGAGAGRGSIPEGWGGYAVERIVGVLEETTLPAAAAAL
jgi:hypothetical protein